MGFGAESHRVGKSECEEEHIITFGLLKIIRGTWIALCPHGFHDTSIYPHRNQEGFFLSYLLTKEHVCLQY